MEMVSDFSINSELAEGEKSCDRQPDSIIQMYILRTKTTFIGHIGYLTLHINIGAHRLYLGSARWFSCLLDVRCYV